MKFLLVLIFFFTTLNSNFLFTQNINSFSYVNNHDPIDHYNFVKKLNQFNVIKKDKDYKIRFDSVYFSNLSGLEDKEFYQFINEENIENDFYYSYSNDKFIPNSYFSFDFNDNNLLTHISYSKPWDGDTIIPGENRTNWIRKATYNQNNKVKHYSYFVPTENGEEFLLSTYDHIYNNAGNLVELHYYSYESGEWTLTDINYYIYNNNTLVEILDKDKDDNGLWFTQDSIAYQYYPDGNLKSTTRYSNLDLEDYFFSRSFIYEYNDQGQLTGNHRYETLKWEGQTSKDINKTYHTYDSLGNLILSENYDSSETHGLRIFSDEHYTYNLDFQSSETQLPRQNPFSFNDHILDKSSIYPIKTYERYGYEQGENPQLIDKEEYFYSDISTSVQESPLLVFPVSISPNPAKDYIHFSFDKNISDCNLSVANIHGQRVEYKQSVSSDSRIDISDLPSGVYVYQISSRIGIACGQFVKL